MASHKRKLRRQKQFPLLNLEEPERREKVKREPVVLIPKKIEPKTENQRKALELVNDPEKKIIFLTGTMRTGKTYIPAAKAAEGLLDGTINRVVFTRPYVEMGEKMGFVPGDLEAKLAPFAESFMEAMEEHLGGTFEAKQQVKQWKGEKKIVTFPLGFMRSKTFHNTWLIVDEAQNGTEEETLAYITRAGYKSRIFGLGDYRRQKDIRQTSGLALFADLLKDEPYFGHVKFTLKDVVFPMVKAILTAYEKYKRLQSKNDGETG